jgi:hypothetical protein
VGASGSTSATPSPRDASIRVYVSRTDPDPSVIVTVRPPGGIATIPQRLEVVEYQRPRAQSTSAWCTSTTPRSRRRTDPTAPSLRHPTARSPKPGSRTSGSSTDPR